MNRREFLTFLGISAAALVAVPPQAAANYPVEVFSAYPRLCFTGLKAAQTSNRLAGQFLWTVRYKDIHDTPGETFWFCNVIVDGNELMRADSRDQATEYVRACLRMGALDVTRMMDDIVVDAANGLAQTGAWHQIPNPSFDPELPETTPYSDEYDVWNTRLINGDPIKTKIKGMQFGAYQESDPVDAWDIEKLTVFAMERIGRSFRSVH